MIHCTKQCVIYIALCLRTSKTFVISESPEKL